MYRETEPHLSSQINVLSYEDGGINKLFEPLIMSAYEEARYLLPKLPQVINIEFGTNYPYGEDGVTGSALSPDSMKIGIRIDQDDRTSQYRKVKQVVMHEAYHIGQGFYNSKPCSALEAAIYEGCASVFEKEYLSIAAKWTNYAQHTDEELFGWLEQIKNINADQYFESSGETWRKWAFFDPDTGESWRIYKTGTWLIEKIIAKNDVNSLELNDLNAEQIYKMI